MSKPVIPVKLSECKVHPRLEPAHYVDFSYPKSLPWAELINRLKEVEVEVDLKPKSIAPAAPRFEDSAIEEAAGDVLSYLNSKGFTMASFERLRQVNTSLSLDMLNAIITKNPGLFRHVKVKGGKPGIAKRVP
jgi:hypothetical protein